MAEEIEYLGLSKEINRVGMPRVLLRFAEVEGRAECVRIEIGARFGEPDPRRPVPLTTTAIRKIPLAQLIDEARTEWVGSLDEIAKGTFMGEPIHPSWRGEARKRLPLAQRSARRKRVGKPRKYDREHFEEVARVYREGYRAGKPTLAVQKRWQVEASTANKWVSRARHEFGLLPKTDKGVARITPRRGRR